MAKMVRKSLDQIKAEKPKFDEQKFAATTEEDIRGHAIEDGEDPDAPLTGFVLKSNIAELRNCLGMTQERFAAALRVPLATLRNWEQGRVMPDPAARALLKIVSEDPEAAFTALAS